jgi:hypothetical protein
VIGDTLFHNVNRETFASRALHRAFGDIPVPPPSRSPDDAIPEGPVSPYHFPFAGNPIGVWDPKLDFSSHLQVHDDGRLWQWKIADFVPVEGESHGRWVSTDLDLEPLDEVRVRLAELRNAPVRPGELGHEEFERRVRDFYGWLEGVRAPIRRQLWDIHVGKKARFRGPGKVVNYAPPKLSMFEDFTVKDGEIYTRFHAEPVFYRALVRHARRATEMVANANPPHGLHDVYDERVQAIICAAACLEAFVNTVGAERVSSWLQYEPKLDMVAKWHLCLAIHGKDAAFASGREPYQSFCKVAELRNHFLHYKRPLKRAPVSAGKSTTWIGREMDAGFVEKVPRNALLIIRDLCAAIDCPVPAWLEPGVGWDL